MLPPLQEGWPGPRHTFDFVSLENGLMFHAK